MTPISDQSINEDSNFFYVLEAQDLEQDPLSYSYVIDQDINASINGDLL